MLDSNKVKRLLNLIKLKNLGMTYIRTGAVTMEAKSVDQQTTTMAQP